jgi:long-chain fatty acid transport protein
MQITGALHALKPSFKFSNAGSTGIFAGTGTGEGGDGGGWAYVPNGFFTMSITPNLRFGVALNAPFGLTTDYDTGWRGRAVAQESAIKTVNINPSLAYKVSDTFSIGGGLNIQKIDAKLSSDLGVFGRGLFTLKADDIGYGFNLGATFHPSAITRIGAHYRSSVKYKLDGNATFSTFAAGNGPVTADLKTPDSASLSVLHLVSPSLEVMADITWTKWSNLQQLVAVYKTGVPLTTLQFRWDDTLRFGVGANYKLNAQTKLRFGLAYDKTPTNDVERTPRLPDQDRTWLAFGVQYKPSKQGTLEIAYAHEFVKDARVSGTSAAPLSCPAHCLSGTFKDKADILSIQYSHTF